METNTYTLMFDGGSTGNPGPSGSGSVLYENGEEIWCEGCFWIMYESHNTRIDHFFTVFRAVSFVFNPPHFALYFWIHDHSVDPFSRKRKIFFRIRGVKNTAAQR